MGGQETLAYTSNQQKKLSNMWLLFDACMLAHTCRLQEQCRADRHCVLRSNLRSRLQSETAAKAPDRATDPATSMLAEEDGKLFSSIRTARPESLDTVEMKRMMLSQRGGRTCRPEQGIPPFKRKGGDGSSSDDEFYFAQ